MSIAKKSVIEYISLAALIIAWTTSPAQAQTHRLPPQDVVVLIDSSESMTPYLTAITGILSRFVGGVQRGDSFVCYQFSNQPILIAKIEFGKPGDVAKLRAQLLQLRQRGKLTNFSPAIQRAMADMRNSHIRHPSNERVLILITDGRRHRNDMRSEKKAFGQLLKKYFDLKAGTDYSYYCFYIGDWIEGDLQEYLLSTGAYLANWPKDVQWLDRLTIADISIIDKTVSLGAMPDVPAQGSFSMVFHPRRPPLGVSMLEFEMRAKFTEKTLDRYFTVSPRRFICQEKPWSEKFALETRGFTKGDYSGILAFRPSEPRALLLYPRLIDFSFSISSVLRVNIPAPLEFGPTGMRGEYSETMQISITPSGAHFPGSADEISIASEIELPEGVRLNFSKIIKNKEILVDITVSRDQALSSQAGGKYEGRFTLTAQSGWSLAESEIPLSVEVARRSLDRRAAMLYAAIAIGCVAVVVLLVLVFGNIRKAVLDYLTQKTRPIGKLIVTADPTRGIAKHINLDRLSEKRRVREILVGAGGGVHVDLPHISMIDKAYRFSGRKAEGDVHTVIEAVKTTDEVIVNGMSHTGEIRLRHLDRVKLGAFGFRYEEPRPLRQVVLYYLTGEAVEGWLLSWNIDAEGFHFLVRDDSVLQKEQKESYARFYELKAVAFVRDFDGELTRRLLSLKIPSSGHRVRLFLADLEELVGYVLNWQEPGEKFYLFPDSMGDNIMFFVIERSTIKEMTLLKENEGGARRARRGLSRILGKMKTEVRS